MKATTATTKSKPYKWINQEIAKLDPHKDYVEIWRLSTEYAGNNEFIQNLVYATTFSNFIPTPWGSEAVWRGDGGKVIYGSTERQYQTQMNNSIWWYYGPHDARAKKSADHINRIHEYYENKYPGHFSHINDFLYVMCFSAATTHRLKERMGLKGFTEKQKIAAHIFWKEMSALFVVYQDKPVSLNEHFPKDFDGIIKFCESVEENEMVTTEKGHLITEALFDQFAYRFFPPGLRAVGRALPNALSLPAMLKANGITPLHPVLRGILLWVLGCVLWFLETVMPDHQIAYQEYLTNMTAEEQAKRRKERKELDEKFPAYFNEFHKDAPGCPFTGGSKKMN